MPDTNSRLWEQHERKADNAMGRTAFLLVVTIAVGLVGGLGLSSRSSRWGWGVMILSAIIIILSLTDYSRHFSNAWETLRSSWYDQYSQFETLKGRYQLLSNFIKDFRPAQDQVDQVLRKAAFDLKTACSAQGAFLRNATTSYCHAPEHVDDLEQSIKSLEEFRRKEEAILSKEVIAAKDEFWRLWKLADEQGYNIYTTWKPYVLPHEEWSSPCPTNIGHPVGQTQNRTNRVDWHSIGYCQ